MQEGDDFLWLPGPFVDIYLNNTLSTTAQTLTLTVPQGVKVQANINCSMYHGAGCAVLISSLDQTDTAPVINGVCSMQTAGGYSAGAPQLIRTNTSSQIR